MKVRAFAAALLLALVGACTGAAPTATTAPTEQSSATPSPAASLEPVGKEVSAVGPAARGYHPMVSLGPDRGVLLFGGSTAPPPAGGVWLFDTWSFSATDGWRPSSAPPPALGGNMAYDSQSQRVISLANVGRDQFDKPAQTWVYDPSRDEWTQMAPAEQPSVGGEMTFDSESDRVLLFAAETWAYDLEADSWTHKQRMPRPAEWFRVAYDSQSDRVIRFGGVGRNDTWAYDYDTDTWTEMTPEVSPAARHYHAMDYDPTTDRVILYGGTHGSFRREVPFDDTWAYDYESNTWTELATQTSPGARGWHAMAYGGTDRKLVLFGGGPDRDSYTAETWLFDPATQSWTQYLP